MNQQDNNSFEDYLHDESRSVGYAESISFPVSEKEVINTIQKMRVNGTKITLQGARTGITGGSVPYGGHILNLSRMNQIGSICEDAGKYSVIVQPGALLADIRKTIAEKGLFFPPDPTEPSASIGGMIACNASGALTYHYGPTRNWILALRLVLPNGEVIRIRRGERYANNRHFELQTESGAVVSGQLPSYQLPNVKSAAGYYAADDMDLIDLLIGMEGTLGIVTEAELRLIPKPKCIDGLTIFPPSEEAALNCVSKIRDLDKNEIHPVAIEYFNTDALNLLRRMKKERSAFEKIPSLSENYQTAIYIEFHGEDEEILEEGVMSLVEALADYGIDSEDTWFATTDREMEPLKAFRHAIPEAVNLLIDERKRDFPKITKLGTDMSVPDEYLGTVMEMYHSDLAANNLQFVIFGHIGNNHVHVNILPRNMEEYERGESLYYSWASRVIQLGGSISAEHGIGKIKVPFLEMMFGKEGITEMKNLKSLFDPNYLLNTGNLFK